MLAQKVKNVNMFYDVGKFMAFYNSFKLVKYQDDDNKKYHQTVHFSSKFYLDPFCSK